MADKIQQRDGEQPTPEQQAATARADALAQSGLSETELASAEGHIKGYIEKRKKEVDNGLNRQFSKKNQELTTKEQQLDAELQRSQQLNQQVEATLAKLGNVSAAGAHNAEAEFDAIVDKYQGKIDDGTLTVTQAADKIKAEQKALLAKINTPKPASSGARKDETMDEAIARHLAERDQQAVEHDRQTRQEAAITSIAEKLAKKYGCDVDDARALYLSKLDKHGDVVVALQSTNAMLARLAPAQQPDQAPKEGPLTLKPRQGAENAGAAPGSEMDAIMKSIQATSGQTG